MFNNPFNKKLFLAGTLVLLLFGSSYVLAKNPITLLLPTDNIIDPGSPLTPWGGCGPQDANCYIQQTINLIPKTKTVSTSQAVGTPTTKSVGSTISNQALLTALRSLLASPLPADILNNLRGPQGLKGDAGVTIQSTSPAPAVYLSGAVIPPNPANYYAGGSLFSATDLSSTNFITNTAKVTTLTVSGDSTFSGIVTTPSLVVSKIYPPTDSTTAIQINKADGTTNVMNVDTTNGYVGIGTTSPSELLDVNGNAWIENNLYAGVKKNLVATKSSITTTIYVDATNGNDSTGDGSVSLPYQTITKAISVLPDVILNNYTIQLAPGIYRETVTITKILGSLTAKLIIKGDSINPNSYRITGADAGAETTRVRYRGVYINSVPFLVSLQGLLVDYTRWAILVNNASLELKNVNINNAFWGINVYDNSSVDFPLDADSLGYLSTVNITNITSGGYGIYLSQNNTISAMGNYATINITGDANMAGIYSNIGTLNGDLDDAIINITATSKGADSVGMFCNHPCNIHNIVANITNFDIGIGGLNSWIDLDSGTSFNNVTTAIKSVGGSIIDVDATTFTSVTTKYMSQYGGVIDATGEASALENIWGIPGVSAVADGVSAVAYNFDTLNQLTTTGAKLFSVKNFGSEKFVINATGNVGIGIASPTGKLSITQTATDTGALKGIVYTGAVNTNQTLSTEIPSLTLTTAGRQWATGALTTQREVLITQPTYSFVGASTITDAATVGIAGAPIKSTNATITNTHGLLIQAGAVSTATNSYGLTVNAQTGASANYSAVFLGGNVGIGTTTPLYPLHISGYSGSDGHAIYADGTYSANNAHVIQIQTIHPLVAGGGAAMFDTLSSTSGTENINHIVSYQSRLIHASSGTLDNMYGVFVQHTNNGGNIASLKGFTYRNFVGTGTATNQYALYIEDMANATNNYSFYAEAGGKFVQTSNASFGTTVRLTDAFNVKGVSYFDGYASYTGSVGIGVYNQSSPVSLLHVMQSATISTSTDIVTIGGGAMSVGAEARIKFSAASGAVPLSYIGSAFQTDATDSYISFGVRKTSAISEAMRINKEGNVGIGTTTPTYKLDVKGTTVASGIRSDMGFDIYQVPNPTAPTGVATAGAGLEIGNYYYRITYTTAVGETGSTASAVITTTAGNQQVTLTIPVSTDPRVTGRKIYRTKVGGSAATDYAFTAPKGIVADNTTTTYVDDEPDASLPDPVNASYYRANSTTNYISLNGTRSAMIDANGTYFGTSVAQHITTGGMNSLYGASAGHAITTGSTNNLFGHQAGASISTGNENIAIGYQTLLYNQTGSNNVAIGNSALYGVSTNSNGNNTAIGTGAGYLVTTGGNNNTYLGFRAGYAGTTGASNLMLGYLAGRYETAGNKIILDTIDRTTEALGRTSALIYGVTNATPASQILALGGGGKVGIGTIAPGNKLVVQTSTQYDGLIVNNGTYNIGWIAGQSTENDNGQLALASAGVTTVTLNSSGDSYINSGGNFGIGQTSPGYLLHVGSTSVTDATVLLRLQDADSTCDFTANLGAPACGSDESLKKNILELTGNLDKITSLRPITYNWLTDTDDTNIKHGFIAQEVATVMPELVTDGIWIDGSTKKFLQMEGMIPYMVGAIKEMNLGLTMPDAPLTETLDGVETKTFAGKFFDRLSAWFGNIENGVKDFYTNRVRTKEICISDESGETCITKTQLDAILNANTSSVNTTPEPQPQPEAPQPSAEITPEEPQPEANQPSVIEEPTDQTPTEEIIIPEPEIKTVPEIIPVVESQPQPDSAEEGESGQPSEESAPEVIPVL
ncbi:MAG: tail fiber domain-containing protein [Candidatus Paceibacterota bacterium]|jgi:hypothetical protein